MKNKKGGKNQKFIAQVEKQVQSGGNPIRRKDEEARIAQKKAKEDAKKREEEEKGLLNKAVIVQKVGQGKVGFNRSKEIGLITVYRAKYRALLINCKMLPIIIFQVLILSPFFVHFSSKGCVKKVTSVNSVMTHQSKERQLSEIFMLTIGKLTKAFVFCLLNIGFYTAILPKNL